MPLILLLTKIREADFRALASVGTSATRFRLKAALRAARRRSTRKALRLLTAGLDGRLVRHQRKVPSSRRDDGIAGLGVISGDIGITGDRDAGDGEDEGADALRASRG